MPKRSRTEEEGEEGKEEGKLPDKKSKTFHVSQHYLHTLDIPKSWVERVKRLPAYLCIPEDVMTQLLVFMSTVEPTKAKIVGKDVILPRKQLGVRRTAYPQVEAYRFSGITLATMEEKELPPAVQKWIDALATFVEEREKRPYQQLLINKYDEDDYIGAHADSESQLDREAAIYNFSFSNGPERTFKVWPKKLSKVEEKGKKKPQRKCWFEVSMPHNSLLVMRGAMQQHFKHGVPKLTKTAKKGFVGQEMVCLNITLRSFRT